MLAFFASSCPSCEAGRLARAQLLDAQVLTWLALATLPFVVLTVAALVAWRRAPLAAAGVMLGTGLGGFVDGILLHQLLQWHNMLSSVRPPTDLVTMKLNMLGDGAFHALTWAATAAGLALLWRAVVRRGTPLATRTLVGSLAIGWGAFNLLEGVLDHQLLGIHHVHPGTGEVAWDVGFLALGALLCAFGYLGVRRERTFVTPAHAPG